MPLLYHSGALGDFLLSLPFLRALARVRGKSSGSAAAGWTFAVPAEHARLVARIFPHERRIAPGSQELAPLALGVRRLDGGPMGALADLSARYGGLFGFVRGALELEAALKARCPDLPAALAEPLALAVPAGRSIEDVLEEAIERASGERMRLGPADFAIGLGELPPTEASGSIEVGDAARRGAAPLALLHPGASDPAKMMPAGFFVELRRVLEARGFDVKWALGPVEREQRVSVPPGPVLEDLDLVSLAHAIARADVYVGCDTGPTHLASALGIVTVALHRVSNPAWRPRGARAIVVAVPSGAADLDITIRPPAR